VQAGGLMSYAPNTIDLYRRAATYVDKTLKGSKPADLPIEQPKKFEFIINLNAAKQIGVTIPPNVLAKPVTMEELLVSSLAQTDALAKLLLAKGLITGDEFMQKISEERVTYQQLLNPTNQ
jgi:ABC transporter substrate binding protein